MAKKSRRSRAQVERAMAKLAKDVKPGQTRKTKAQAMRQVAALIREVVALEKRTGGGSSVFSLTCLPSARPRRTGGAKRRRPK
jgi:hypothetical protein